MPYIVQDKRDHLRDPIHDLAGRLGGPGDLNYSITMLVQQYLVDDIQGRPIINYRNLNEVIGVLECVKLEYYRRLVTPYEDIKIQENGDVYGSLYRDKT